MIDYNDATDGKDTKYNDRTDTVSRQFSRF